MKLAARMNNLGTETAFEVLAKAKALEAEGKNIVHMEIGEPDFDTPRNIVEAAHKALDEGWTHYGPSAGQPVLREAAAEYTTRTRGVEYTADNVVVTSGAKPIMWYTLIAVAEPGVEIIYPNPGFPIYESVIEFMGAKAVPVHIKEEKGFSLDVDELEGLITDKTRLVILNSPSNPTGGVTPKEDLERIAALCVENDIWCLSDEIYDNIVYEGKFESITQFPGMPERTIILNGMSKTYAMTGWRLGYGVMPAELVPKIGRLMTNSDSCTASFTQMAGVEALRGPQDDVHKMVAQFNKRRDYIIDGLNAIEGITCLKPSAAFYAFPNVKSFGRTSQEISDHLLYDGNVACLAGTCFGAFGEGYLRFSFATSIENIEEGLKRVDESLKRL